MRLYTKEMLIEAIDLAQQQKSITTDRSYLLLYSKENILKLIDDKYKQDSWVINGKLVTKDNIKETMKIAIDYKVNSTEELNKILNGGK